MEMGFYGDFAAFEAVNTRSIAKVTNKIIATLRTPDSPSQKPFDVSVK
jgi:hypothetical protein